MDLLDQLQDEVQRRWDSVQQTAVTVYNRTMDFISCVLFFPFLNIVMAIHAYQLWYHVPMTEDQELTCIFRFVMLWLLGIFLGYVAYHQFYPHTIRPLVVLVDEFAHDIITLAWPVTMDDFARTLLWQWSQHVVFLTPPCLLYLAIAGRISPGISDAELHWTRYDGGFGDVFYFLFGFYAVLTFFFIFAEHRFAPIVEVLWKWFNPREPVP